MKKRIVFLIVLMVSIFILNGCKNKLDDLPDNPIKFSYGIIKYEDDGAEYRTIKYENKTYIIYGSVKSKDNTFGECLGYIDDDKNNRIYELKGESKDIWLIQYNIKEDMENATIYKNIENKGDVIPESINPFDFNY